MREKDEIKQFHDNLKIQGYRMIFTVLHFHLAIYKSVPRLHFYVGFVAFKITLIGSALALNALCTSPPRVHMNNTLHQAWLSVIKYDGSRNQDKIMLRHV
jgi:hypothetical protein